MINISALRWDLSDAWRVVRRRRFQTLVSIAGIAVGVMALLLMFAVNDGALQKIREQAESMGLDSIRIEMISESAVLDEQDVIRLRNWIGSEGQVSGWIGSRDVTLSKYDRKQLVDLIATESVWKNAEKIEVDSGRFLVPVDLLQKKRVCLVGQEVSVNLGIQVGDQVLLDDLSCQVVGVMAHRPVMLTGGTELASVNFDKSVIIPYTMLEGESLFNGGYRRFQGIVIRMKSVSNSELSHWATRITHFLNREGVSVVAPWSLIRKAEKDYRHYRIAMGVIAAIAMLLGGVGVMNVVLANVAEQTREIGLRLALGATHQRILQLYLLYAVMLCAAGSAAGAVSGVCLALILDAVVGVNAILSVHALLLGPVLSIVVGVVFGAYPARRAARLSPVTALRTY